MIPRWLIAPRSLFARLSLFAGVGATALLALLGIGLTTLYRSVLYRDINQELDSTISSLISAAELDGEENLVVSVELPRRYSETFSGLYWVIAPADAPQRPWARSRSLWDERLRINAPQIDRAIADPSQIFQYSAEGPEELPLYIRVRSVRLGPGAEPLLFFAAAERSRLDQDVRQFALTVFWALALAALALLGLVLAMVQLGLRPLFAFRVGVSEVRAGARKRLDGVPPTELAPLADELNALIDHNEQIIARARAQAGDLAHALKTPIAVMVAEAEGEDSDLAKAVRRQAEITREHVERHLKRAGAAARARDVRIRTPLAPVLEDLRRTVPKLYPDRNIAISIDAEPVEEDDADVGEVSVRAAREDVTEMVGNLMDNAYKWARAQVRLDFHDDGERRVVITVHDDGPGLSPEHRSAVVRRGTRLDETTPGSGLGLAIVNDLADAIGGELSLDESAMGGLAARLALPRAATSEA